MKRKFYLTSKEREELLSSNFKVRSLEELVFVLMRQRQRENLLGSDDIIYHYTEELKEELRRKHDLQDKIVSEYACNIEGQDNVTFNLRPDEGAIYFVYSEQSDNDLQ